MKIAIFGDIHGYIYGLNTIMEDIKKEKVDKIYYADDLFIPFPGVKEVWKIKILLLLGFPLKN